MNGLAKQNRKVFVDTNISLETLRKIAPKRNVLIMLADPNISVNRFFERPDKEKQFLYQLLMEEDEPENAMINFRHCLMRINSKERYNTLLNSGFQVVLRDDNRAIDDTLAMVENAFGLQR